MKQESINLKNIAVCLYGIKYDNVVNQIKNFISLKFINKEINFYENFTDGIDYKDLWKFSYSLKDYEITTGSTIDLVLCICLNDEVKNNFLVNFGVSNLLSNMHVSELENNTIYFSYGKFNPHESSTEYSPDIFYSNAITFELVSNFGIIYQNLPTGRKGGSLNKDFYYFLKTLNIKTRCINYENSSLFKRSA